MLRIHSKKVFLDGLILIPHGVWECLIWRLRLILIALTSSGKWKHYLFYNSKGKEGWCGLVLLVGKSNRFKYYYLFINYSLHFIFLFVTLSILNLSSSSIILAKFVFFIIIFLILWNFKIFLCVANLWKKVRFALTVKFLCAFGAFGKMLRLSYFLPCWNRINAW